MNYHKFRIFDLLLPFLSFILRKFTQLEMSFVFPSTKEYPLVLERKTTLADFEIGKELGSGMSGTTYMATNRVTGEIVAIKIVSKLTPLDDEVTILQHLQPVCHPYILCYLDYFEDDDNYYIVTEFLGDYITLRDYINQYHGTQSQATSVAIIKNLVEGLKLIHSQGIVHRDIITVNVMINSSTNEIKYIDFGEACSRETCAQRVNWDETMDELMKDDYLSLGFRIYELVRGKTFDEDYADEKIKELKSTDLHTRNELRNTYSGYAYFITPEIFAHFLPLALTEYPEWIPVIISLITSN